MKKIIKQIPFAKPIYRFFQEKQYKHRFARDCYGCFSGVFQTFEEAIESAPQTKSIGYDSAELAQEYQQMLEDNNWENSGGVIASYDYPIIFWLSSIFHHNQGKTIFDFGGNVGIHFYSYAKYIEYPKNLTWMVCDVPAIVNHGITLAKKRSVENLEFTVDLKDVKGKEIFISSGAIQYVENLASSLSLYHKPKHLLLNRLPLYNGNQYVTLQNGGKVFYPQYVFNQIEFIEQFSKIGYELVDIWEDRNDSCIIIPYDPEKSVPFYHGLYFKLKA
ncbi:MAG: methyltransferase, TIGR04325 family [Brasilonema octagenarum HA4186-MV1]|jgi:putative methyltransferase (TIGR04325 family)|nr:methyltransferase, TIGR04325 family [Brasilonema octagenarum HA4186-MV1]